MEDCAEILQPLGGIFKDLAAGNANKGQNARVRAKALSAVLSVRPVLKRAVDEVQDGNKNAKSLEHLHELLDFLDGLVTRRVSAEEDPMVKKVAEHPEFAEAYADMVDSGWALEGEAITNEIDECMSALDKHAGEVLDSKDHKRKLKTSQSAIAAKKEQKRLMAALRNVQSCNQVAHLVAAFGQRMLDRMAKMDAKIDKLGDKMEELVKSSKRQEDMLRELLGVPLPVAEMKLYKMNMQLEDAAGDLYVPPRGYSHKVADDPDNWKDSSEHGPFKESYKDDHGKEHEQPAHRKITDLWKPKYKNGRRVSGLGTESIKFKDVDGVQHELRQVNGTQGVTHTQGSNTVSIQLYWDCQQSGDSGVLCGAGLPPVYVTNDKDELDGALL
eukprot:gene7228-16925_t